MKQSDESLPPERRVAYYRSMAAEALHLAQTASEEAQKAGYLDIAARWNTLANEVERQSARQPDDRRFSKDESASRYNEGRH